MLLLNGVNPMKKTRRILAVLLALVMALTAVCITAFAAHKKQYTAYTFFGDSVTAAAGLPSYYTFYHQDPVTGKWEGTAEGQRVEGCYADLVAKGVGIDNGLENYYNESHSGWRTSEVREVFDETYYNDDGAVAKALSDAMANGKAISTPSELRERVIEEVSTSDLITLDLGSNDVQLPIIIALYTAMNPTASADYKAWMIEKLLTQYGSTNELIQKLAETVVALHGAEFALETIAKATLTGLNKFRVNYPAIINAIHELNPDADIYVIGLYNPLSDTMISEQLPIPIGKVLDPMILSMNLYLSQLCPARNYYTYVDAFNTAVLGTINASELFTGGGLSAEGMGAYTLYVHPSLEGHAYIADQVLKAIPDVEDEAPAEEPAEQTILNGLCKGSDGLWAMYSNSKVDTSFNGLAKSTYNGNWYMVKNGYVDWGYTGFGQNPTTKKWYRVKDGRVDWTANSIYKKPETGTWFKTTDGRVTFKETGVFQNENGWWYVKNSWVDFNKNGKVKYNGKTYTVKNGRAIA